jgi:hypothetical protein
MFNEGFVPARPQLPLNDDAQMKMMNCGNCHGDHSERGNPEQFPQFIIFICASFLNGS